LGGGGGPSREEGRFGGANYDGERKESHQEGGKGGEISLGKKGKKEKLSLSTDGHPREKESAGPCGKEKGRNFAGF